MDKTSPYHPPDIPGWVFRTNSCAPTAERAEAAYRNTIAEIMAKYNLTVPRFQVRVEPFTPDPEIRFAIYIRT